MRGARGLVPGTGKRTEPRRSGPGTPPTTPEPPLTRTHLRHKAGGCSGSCPAGPSEDTSARGQASSIMRTTASSRTGKSVSVRTATCGQGTVTRGLSPRLLTPGPPCPSCPTPSWSRRGASCSRRGNDLEMGGVSPGGRRPAHSQHPSRQPAHSQQTAPPTRSTAPPTPCRRPRPLPADSPSEPPALSAPAWAHFPATGGTEPPGLGLDRKERGTRGLPSPRKSGPGGGPSRDEASKVTGLVQRTQGRLAGACGRGGPAGEGDSHKSGAGEGGPTGSAEAESGRAEWTGSGAGGPALLHERRSGSTWCGEGDAQDQ